MPSRNRPSAKADFVRSLDPNLAPRHVIAQAKAAGISLSPTYVHLVRKQMTDQGPAPQAKAERRPAPSRGAAPASGGGGNGGNGGGALPGSKKAFVLSYPANTPAAEVVAAAKSRGLDLTLGYLYWVRSDAARGARRGGAAAPAASAAKKSAPAQAQGQASAPAKRGPGRPPAAARTEAPRPAAASTGAPARETPRSGADAERLIVDTALRVIGIERAIAVLEAARGRLGRLLQELVVTSERQ